MYRLTILLLVSLLSACSVAPTKTIKVVPEDVSEIIERTSIIDKEFVDMIAAATDISPLELYLYREIDYNVMLIRGSKVVYMSYTDYVKLIDLLKVLENRIEIREQQIDDIIDIHKRKQIRDGKQLEIP